VEDARMVCIQEIRSIEDELAQKVFQQLRLLQYGDPFGRSSPGTLDSVQATSLDDIRQYVETTFHPNQAIIGVAGRFDWPQLRDHVAGLFEDWQQQPPPSYEEIEPTERTCHFPHDSTQTHIGVGYANVPYAHPDYYRARAAVGVLSDGMSSRLFTEVRENRGLCYAVHAGCHSLRDRGSVLCYAGTTAERAQETLDVLIAELVRLSDGISADELDRLKAKIKSALIMQQESSPARSGSIASDWYHLGRVQTLDELRGIIDGLTCDSINDYLASNRPADFRIVTLGAQELEKPGAVS
jgi:predicted Zn-dependent peptidase